MASSLGSEIGCIVLAAGKSSRLGSPKALLEVGGISLISWILTRLNRLGLRPVVVTRENLADEIRESVEDAEIIVNENPELGRTGSVKKGLIYLKERMRNETGILIVPVDRPGFSISTVELLISSKSSSCPFNDGRGGHPLFVDSHDIERILESSSDEPLNRIINPVRVLVEDPYLHLNIDTIEDVNEFLKVVDFL